MALPLVSVLIPCFNAERFVGKTLESVFHQTWMSIEIIVVNDGSTDKSLAEIERLRRENVTVLNQPKMGAAAARNMALCRARGDFIQYLDADDLIAPDKVEKQMWHLARYPGYIASCEWGRFQSDSLEAKFVPEEVWRDFDTGIEFSIASWLGGGMMPLMAWLSPRHVIEIAGPWNEELSVNDDGEYFTRVLLASKGVKFCEGARCFYRSGLGRSMSGRRDRAALTSAYRATEYSSANILADANNATTRTACAWQFQRFAYEAYPDARDLVRMAEQRCAELGGSSLQPGGGWGFQVAAELFGWKVARRAQVIWRSGIRRRAGMVAPC